MRFGSSFSCFPPASHLSLFPWLRSFAFSRLVWAKLGGLPENVGAGKKHAMHPFFAYYFAVVIISEAAWFVLVA
ncbi:hypothetical protein M441DRAFT_294314 [Trichoderma asperellum CBS 433.97]|uniref:Uncharacterized protein n=1 Tax=Trichoderma asperellum (strain ATCC 204424 / CBS 433.97 / NBRC 101777) TaxID=1042311 RepID=A0A2T3YTI6_TRIA4|nr:hypothetical protein M441DRAFT_294314 [Trichoderma asperellum CBS 433.97]PTB35816.1 hypothetical protein M441DRAFT_294314 [Trichoderma asperellum CBS 433.97]